eukprot:scaffold25332_cov186-Cylindrotheca_fusiformis.AAC.2
MGRQQREGFCTPKRCCGIFCCLFIVALIAVIVWYFAVFKGEDGGIASCGDCFCIAGANGTCPSRQPLTNFTDAGDDVYWKEQTVVNPYSLSCDAFTESNCETQPAQEQALLDLGDTAACAIHSVDSTTDCKEGSYTLKSYASREEAEAAGGFVTHMGSCGVCSTLQDLAVYMRHPDLTTAGKFCSSKDTISIEGGAACYSNLGMTNACARVWADANANDFVDCFTECFLKDLTQNEPNNGPFPECKLNKCLQCDQDKTEPTLTKFAGRTQRRSGLLSPVARPCDEIAIINHSRCPVTTPL